MLLEIIGRSYPFAYACTSPIDLVQALEDLRSPDDIPILRSCPPRMQTFLSKMLAKNSKMRASAGWVNLNIVLLWMLRVSLD